MKESKYVKAIREWWKVGYALEGEQLNVALYSTVANGTTWVKSADLFKDKSGLGVMPRMILIRDFVRQGKDLKFFYDKLYTRQGKKLLPGRHEFEGVMRLNNVEEPPQKFYHPSVAEMLATLIDAAAGRSSSSNLADKLFSKVFSGPFAIEDYTRWLSSGAKPDVFVNQTELPDFVSNAERRAVMCKLRGLISLQSTSSMVINLHQKGMWEGLRAVVPQIVAMREKTDHRAILYIPLVSYSADYMAPGYLQILAYIDAFFSGQEVTGARVLPDVNPDTVVERVRLKMAETPAIVILDGYSDSSMEFEELERAIADDFLINLIRKLTAPPLCHLTSNAAIERFYQNRIFVLSDAKFRGAIEALDVEIPLPDREIMAEVFEQQKLKNKAEVGSLLRIDALVGARSEAVLFALDALVSVVKDDKADNLNLNQHSMNIHDALQSVSSSPYRDSGETVIAAVVQVLLDQIKSRSPGRYWLLVLIASTPGGIREDTLRRLIVAASRVTDDEFRPFEVIPGLGDPSRAIADLKQQCGRVLTDRKSDDFEGLRSAHAAEFPSDFASELGDRERPSLGAIDFAIPEVRHALLASVPRSNLNRVQSLHRLLAEESLTQATISFRHDPDQSSVRSLRRLLGVLYHGFMSLPVSHMELSDAKIRSVDFAMPVDPSKLWEWLYLFAYRRLIERPPIWRLSRFHGADAIKQEILDMVERPWKLWGRYPAARRYIDEAEGSLITNRPADIRRNEIALDFFISRSQAAYSLGQLNRSAFELNKSAHIAAQTPRSRLRLAKRELDLALLTQDDKKASLIEKEVLSFLGMCSSASIDQFIRSFAAKITEISGPGNFAPLVLGIPPAMPVIEVMKSAREGGEWGPSELSEISDVLFRIGERYALAGDTKYSDITLGIQRRGIQRRSHDNAAFLGDMTTSMAYFRLAEALRLEVFSGSPYSEYFFASGHSARQHVRVALKMERYSREQMDEGWAPVPGFFARKARQMSDVVTRHLYQYPRERASLLILESTMARLIPVSDQRAAALRSARLFLQRAEPVVLALGPETRVRMRFLLERIKVHRRMSLLRETKEPAFPLRCAEIDLVTLGELVDRHGLPLWQKLFEIQRDAVARVRREVG